MIQNDKYHRSHITVCICTYKRPILLAGLLQDLSRQESRGKFDFSVVVVDNDKDESARSIVTKFAENSQLHVDYCVEPVQNIALARNCAVRKAKGDYLAFIDDDETPIGAWLLTLYDALHAHSADGVLGPVKPRFEEKTPEWVIKGRFYERDSYPTGLVIDWKKGRTGNVLLRRTLFSGLEAPFRKDFLTGEDLDFFRRMITDGFKFVWCNEATAFEFIPPSRCRRSFMLRRALLRGKVSLRHPTTGTRDILTSAVALPLYSCLLPFTLLAGHHTFMKLLVRTFDHAGRILALMGIDPVSEQYVTE